MTRWAMVADLRRCVGCQTCTAACKHANATPPGVQWRRVLDIELGEYPDVQRAFVPVGCQHCDDPPCMTVCPTTATSKRADGIVTIDYDLCIGCAYCAVACPYQARYKTDRASLRLRRARRRRTRRQRHDPARIAVATKCTFCVERIDHGVWRTGRRPASTPTPRRPASTPAFRRRSRSATSTTRDATCRSCWPETSHFRMHEELGTDPGFHYLWDRNDVAGDVPALQRLVAEAQGLA